MVGEIHEAARILDGQHPVLIVVGVRSNPYPYRDIGQPMPKAAQKTQTPKCTKGIAKPHPAPG
jgi:hypothetical protein